MARPAVLVATASLAVRLLLLTVKSASNQGCSPAWTAVGRLRGSREKSYSSIIDARAGRAKEKGSREGTVSLQHGITAATSALRTKALQSFHGVKLVPHRQVSAVLKWCGSVSNLYKMNEHVFPVETMAQRIGNYIVIATSPSDACYDRVRPF